MKIEILYTDVDGSSKFIPLMIKLGRSNPQMGLSGVMPANGWRLRESPPGLAKDWHCTNIPDCQLVIVLQGQMGIKTRDGELRDFRPGEYFLSMDFVPPGAIFDPNRHGHITLVPRDGKPLQTMFVRIDYLEAQKLLDRARRQRDGKAGEK